MGSQGFLRTLRSPDGPWREGGGREGRREGGREGGGREGWREGGMERGREKDCTYHA